MGYASQSGRATTNSRNPRAFATCDGCGTWYNHDQLSWQFDWAGTKLYNKQLLKCQRCLDRPQEQLRTITIPPDPRPVQNPRVEPFLQDETNYLVTSSPVPSVYGWTGILVPDGDFLITSPDGDGNLVTQQTGEPPQGLNEEPGTDPNMDGPVGLPLDNDEIPKSGPLS